MTSVPEPVMSALVKITRKRVPRHSNTGSSLRAQIFIAASELNVPLPLLPAAPPVKATSTVTSKRSPFGNVSVADPVRDVMEHNLL